MRKFLNLIIVCIILISCQSFNIKDTIINEEFLQIEEWVVDLDSFGYIEEEPLKIEEWMTDLNKF